jgi:hypothetical protein
MWSFRNDRLLEPVDITVANLMAALGRYQGRQDLYRHQVPQTLETLRRVAIVESTEASNRIEGIVVSQARLEELMAQEPPALVSAGIRGMDLAFAVEDRFANPVVDGTSVRFFASAGQLTPGEVGTRDGRVVTTLRVPADADSPVQVWVVVPGARAQLEVTIPVMSHQVWLPIAGAQ